MQASTRAIERPLLRGVLADYRLVAVVVGCLFVLVGFTLPFFPQRITAATTRFSDGTVVELAFPTLIGGQHYTQDKTPTDATLESLDIRVAPAPGYGSAWSWFLALAGSGSVGQHISLAISLALPLFGAAWALALVTRMTAAAPAPGRLIVGSINLSLLAVLGLAVAWLHQVDFSPELYALAPDALAPGVGFWVALLGVVSGMAGAWALRRETQRPVFTWWHLVLAVAGGLWLLVRAEPMPFYEIWAFVADGIVVTLRIVSTSFVFILAVSLLGGLGRISRNRIIYGISSLYVEVVRGIPLLVQLLFIWYALPQVFDALGNLLIGPSAYLTAWGEYFVDLRLEPFTAAVLGLTICYGAYGSEIFRAGISSIHHGQIEAARSLGMTYFQAMRYVILPQAIRVILPPVGNEFVALLKDSSLVSVLAVSDLTRRGREYMSRTFLSFDTWILVALCYLVLTLASSRVVEHIEAKSKFER